MSVHNDFSTDDAAASTTDPVDDNLRAGLALLWQAYTYAQDARGDLWDFALEIDKLYETGLTISALRWLIAKGFIKHGQETSIYGDPHRSFRPSDGFNFERTTCLVLTPSGAALADRVLNVSGTSPKSAQSIDNSPSAASDTIAAPRDRQAVHNSHGPQAARKPSWDATRRELSLAGAIVKRFRVPARNQQTILNVFEEEGWPEHIDDPLPISGDVDPHTRLHDAINRLNGHQTNHLLRFHGNGNGTGVSWELRQQAEARQA